MDVNFKYNSVTHEFTLTNNAKKQKGGGSKTFKVGDIIQTQGIISVNLKAAGKFKKDFKLFWFIPTTTTIEGNVDLHSAIGFIRRIGYDSKKGPFFEDTLFFDGIKGSYMQNVEVRIVDDEWFDSNPNDDEKLIEVFMEPRTASTGRSYIFDIFKS